LREIRFFRERRDLRAVRFFIEARGESLSNASAAPPSNASTAVASVPCDCSRCQIIIQITTCAGYTRHLTFTGSRFWKYSTTTLGMHRRYNPRASMQR
jgi:hypothetical protein